MRRYLLYLRLWRPRGFGDYLWLVLIAASTVGWFGLFLDNPFLTGIGIGVAPACAVSAYWWQKQAIGRGKLFGTLIWLKYGGERLERDYQEISRDPSALTKIDAFSIISSHAYNGKRMKAHAEEIERELREEIWMPPV